MGGAYVRVLFVIVESAPKYCAQRSVVFVAVCVCVFVRLRTYVCPSKEKFSQITQARAEDLRKPSSLQHAAMTVGCGCLSLGTGMCRSQVAHK